MEDKKQTIKIITVLLSAFICVMLCVLAGNIVKIINLNRKQSRLNDTLAKLETSYEINEGKIRFLESDEFVEKYAREYLNLSGENDVTYETN